MLIRYGTVLGATLVNFGFMLPAMLTSIIAVMLDKLQQTLVNRDILTNRLAMQKEQDNVDLLLSVLPRYVCSTYLASTR